MKPCILRNPLFTKGFLSGDVTLHQLFRVTCASPARHTQLRAERISVESFEKLKEAFAFVPRTGKAVAPASTLIVVQITDTLDLSADESVKKALSGQHHNSQSVAKHNSLCAEYKFNALAHVLFRAAGNRLCK